MPINITRKGNKLIIELPLFRTPRKSKTDSSKTLIAGTRGEIPTELMSHGSNIILTVSVFTRPSVPEYKHRAKIAMLRMKGKLPWPPHHHAS